MIVTLTLNPSMDYILQVPRLGQEDTLRAQTAFFQPGGKGINVSRVLTRLNTANIAWGFCGGDTGRWLTASLDCEHVAHAFIETAAQTRINPIITDLSTHQQIRVSAEGGPIAPEERDALFQRFQPLPGNVRWMALGGSLPPGIPPKVMHALIERARAQGVPCMLDADGEVLKQGLTGKPYLIKPNQYELQRLVGYEISSTAEMVASARALIQQELVQVVVISLAEAGALLISSDTALKGQAPSVPVMSKVGAGDSMVAGLMKGLLEEVSLEAMLKMGVAAGTAAVMTPGSELCHLSDYEILLSQVTVESVESEH